MNALIAKDGDVSFQRYRISFFFFFGEKEVYENLLLEVTFLKDNVKEWDNMTLAFCFILFWFVFFFLLINEGYSQ